MEHFTWSFLCAESPLGYLFNKSKKKFCPGVSKWEINPKDLHSVEMVVVSYSLHLAMFLIYQLVIYWPEDSWVNKMHEKIYDGW